MSEELPHSRKAEQALLGILLHDNLAVERIPEQFRPEHLFDPVHARLCAAILEAVQRGGAVDPIVLQERFSEDKAFLEMGGFGYLADLVDHAPSGTSTADFCYLVTDLALRRELVRLSEEIAKSALHDREVPALDQIDAVERQLYQLATFQEEKGLTGLDDVFAEALEMAAAAYSRDSELRGLSTGLMDLDKKLGGLAPTDLIIVAARPSMGKTSLCVNIAESVARTYVRELVEGELKVTRGGVAAVFSLEMSKAQLGIRMLSAAIGVSSSRIARGQLSYDEFARMRDAAIELRDAPLYIDDTAAISLEKLATKCRRLKRTVGLHLIVIDYLQLMTCAGSDKMSPNERVAKITQGLKALAKELDVPVIALSQLTRKVEERSDKKPQLADLKESGAIEQDADVVMFVYRHAYYLEREQPKEGSAEHMKWEEELEKCRHEAEIIIGKNRHGSVGVVKLKFNDDTTKFSDTERDESAYAQAA